MSAKKQRERGGRGMGLGGLVREVSLRQPLGFPFRSPPQITAPDYCSKISLLSEPDLEGSKGGS